MDKEPKKPGGENDTERDDIQEIRVNSISADGTYRWCFKFR